MGEARAGARARSRTLLVPLVVLLALLGVAACGDDDDDGGTASPAEETTEPAEETTEFEAGTTMAEIQERGSITVGTKFDQPLFGQKDPRTGEVEGFDVEIAKLIVAAIGDDIEIEFVETPSKVREEVIQNGDVDMVVATYTINDERKQKVAFAGPYYVAGQDIMVKADNDDIQGVEDLNGKRVCSVTGSTSLKNVKEMAPQAQITEFDVYTKCADALGDGRIDAVTTDNVILVGLIEQYGDDFKLVGNPFTEEPYGIGVAKDDQAFRDFVNDRLEEIFESGEWADAYERTVGTVAPEVPEPPEVDRY